MTATAQQLEYLKNSIKSIQDYPKPGILFRDVTSLLAVSYTHLTLPTKA